LLNPVRRKKRFPGPPRSGKHFDQVVPGFPGERQLPFNVPLLQAVFQFPFLNENDIS
jgi:hypothetical protein